MQIQGGWFDLLKGTLSRSSEEASERSADTLVRNLKLSGETA